MTVKKGRMNEVRITIIFLGHYTGWLTIADGTNES